jgi:predicted RNA-binding Zn-ribbon protein involved in translation (DUF1610 family)
MKKEELEKYINAGLNDLEISKIIGCHRTTIGKLKKQFSLDKKIIKNTACKICTNKIKENTRNRSRCNSCNTRIRRYRTKLAAVKYKGSKCENCGWTGPIAAFEFHHKDDNKEFGIGSAANKSWEVVKKEIDKCELLCSNCHRIEHAKHDDEIFLKEVKNYKGNLFE